MKSIVWAVDAGEAALSALAAEVRPEGSRIVGVGEAPVEGLRHGRIVNVGDLTECLVAAVRQAERSSGLRCRAVFYNFDDAAMESHFPCGSRALSGEGQICAEDVSLAAVLAQRSIGRFETSTVYSREVSFLIDGKDAVADPVGVFGRQLDVNLHVLLAQAQHVEDWQRAVERSRIGGSIAVPSLLSSAFGVLDANERQGRRVVWDLGKDIVAGGIFERGGLRDYAGFSAEGLGESEITERVLSATATFKERHPGIEETVFTGDLCEKQVWLRTASPSGFPQLDHPRHASAAGLVRLAAEMPRARSARSQQDLVSGLRRRAEALINEYF